MITNRILLAKQIECAIYIYLLMIFYYIDLSNRKSINKNNLLQNGSHLL